MKTFKIQYEDKDKTLTYSNTHVCWATAQIVGQYNALLNRCKFKIITTHQRFENCFPLTEWGYRYERYPN